MEIDESLVLAENDANSDNNTSEEVVQTENSSSAPKEQKVSMQEENNKAVIFQHATMTYFRMKVKVGDELKVIEWTGGHDRRLDGFEGAYFQTSDPELIKALKAKHEYNKAFFIMDKVDLDIKENSKVSFPSQEAVGANDAPKVTSVVAPEEVTTVQEKCEFINEQFGVAKGEINTAAKIAKWLEANPGKVKFTD